MMTTNSTNSSPQPSDSSSRKPGFLQAREERKKEQALAAWVNEQYTKCKNARSRLEHRWYKNMEMYSGNQWVVSRAAGGISAQQLILPKAPPWRTRLVVNKIRPIIRTELSRCTSQRPNASVVPASSEDEDLFAAQAGEQVWESTYSRKKVNRVLRSAVWWMLITGVGFIKISWDSSKYDTFSKAQGDFCLENVTPFHIFVPDQMVEEIEDQPYE